MRTTKYNRVQYRNIDLPQFNGRGGVGVGVGVGVYNYLMKNIYILYTKTKL